MNPRSAAAALALGLAWATGLAAREPGAAAPPSDHERNFAPFYVERRAPAAANLHRPDWTAVGPFLFEKSPANAAGDTARGFRPFWVALDDPRGRLRARYVLYPLFSYTLTDAETYKWSLFELIRRTDRLPGAGPARTEFDEHGEFDVFPFWFSRRTPDPADSYRALFPLVGTVKHKLGFERLSWTLFPLYVENEKKGATTTFAPWPIIRHRTGAEHGWGLWPLYDRAVRPGVHDRTTVLWPLIYNHTRYPAADAPPGTPPTRDIGALPFYAARTGPGYVNEDFLWPFFGYTDRTDPVRYHERRYLWPFFVQGRGDERHLNRWAPFYSHSVVKGHDKQWFAWPLLRYAVWIDENIERRRTQFLYFVYWHEGQRRVGRAGGPEAELTHLWPLVSAWDNGAGRRQWQFPSPLEVFFPGNEKVRHVWSPLFSLARHQQRAPGDERTSLLWDFVTWEKTAAARRSEFHLGPLVGVTREGEARRIAIGAGLFGVRRSATGSWRMFWWDFPPDSSPAATTASPPTSAPPAPALAGRSPSASAPAAPPAPTSVVPVSAPVRSPPTRPLATPSS